MGCCPSKHKARKGSDLSAYSEYPPTEKIDLDFTPSERGACATAPVCEDKSSMVVKAHEAPEDLLMARGGTIERSDHEIDIDEDDPAKDEDNQADLDMVAISVRPAEAAPGASTLPPLELVDVPKAEHTLKSCLSSSEMPSPVRSPSRPPINYEDMPINSMYHRIHVVEMEEMEAKRQQELQEEAERREREIQEFKASMLTPSEG